MPKRHLVLRGVDRRYLVASSSLALLLLSEVAKKDSSGTYSTLLSFIFFSHSSTQLGLLDLFVSAARPFTSPKTPQVRSPFSPLISKGIISIRCSQLRLMMPWYLPSPPLACLSARRIKVKIILYKVHCG